MIAVLDIFRAEVLLGLWLIRVVARFVVRSWRDSFPDPRVPFPWVAVVADRQDARGNILQLSHFGMSALAVLGGLVFGVPARLLGFPVVLELLTYLAVLAPCAVVLVAHMTIQQTLDRVFAVLPPAEQRALALTAWLPHPSTWPSG